MIQTYKSYRTYKPISIEPKPPQPGGPVGAGGFPDSKLGTKVRKLVKLIIRMHSSLFPLAVDTDRDRRLFLSQTPCLTFIDAVGIEG